MANNFALSKSKTDSKINDNRFEQQICLFSQRAQKAATSTNENHFSIFVGPKFEQIKKNVKHTKAQSGRLRLGQTREQLL
jgi:hypothetical protein